MDCVTADQLETGVFEGKRMSKLDEYEVSVLQLETRIGHWGAC